MLTPLSRRSSLGSRDILSAVLLAGTFALGAAAVLVLVTGGVEWRLGGLRVSMRDAGRLCLESALALLVRELLCRPATAARWRVVALVGFLVVALAWESTPRLIGDGREYVAMTRQFSLGRPPGLSLSDAAEAERFLTALTGYEITLPADAGLIGRDGRQQLGHFWVYSLLVAPFAVIVRLAAAHPNHAFTLLNALLLCGAAAVAVSRIGLAAASLLLLGPAIWWVDKAHTEVLTLTSLTAAAALLPLRPEVAIPLIGLAAAQNPPLVVVLVAAIVWVWTRTGRRPWLACGVGLGIASLHPLYYLWTIGRTSPLAGVTLRHWPGITAYLTPVLDPNLGVVWAFAGLTAGVLLVLPTLLRPRMLATFWVEGALLAACVLLLLFAFAQTPNVNHGGTPGPSRYTMWLVAFAVPLFRVGRLGTLGWRYRALSAVAAISVVSSAVFCHPKLPQDCGRPSRLAAWLLSTWPQLYNPLPEVFVERQLATDGVFPVPVATPGCEKVLLGGERDGTVPWPIPCEPHAVPTSCRAPGVLCYANRSGDGYTFVRAPAQRGLPSPTATLTWDAADRADWDVLGVDWRAARRVRPLSETSFVTRAEAVVWMTALQTDRDLLAWASTLQSGRPSLRLHPRARAAWWQFDTHGPPASLGSPMGMLDPGNTVSLPAGTSVIVLVRVTAVP